MSLPFRDRPQTWVRPRKSKVVPSVSGWRAPCDLFGRKSTRRVLSGWRVSPYRARRLPRTDSTRLASTMLSNAISASSANRTSVLSPLRRGFTSVLVPVFDAMLEKALSLCEASLGMLYRFDGEAIHLLAVRGASEAALDLFRRP